MKKIILLSLFTLLSDPFVLASANKIDLDIELMRNDETSLFKIQTRLNELASIMNSKYRIESKLENLQLFATPNLKAKLNIYEIKNQQEKLLMNPEFFLTDGIMTSFMTEDIVRNDRMQIKITPHVLDQGS